MPSDPDQLILSLDGFDGPLDLLLDLARAQKIDLARISIVALVDQYLAIIDGARKIRLELAADWLVMAAWLAWLKSRLLLPAKADGAEEGAQAADGLAARLAELERMRAGAAWLSARPQLRQDVFARGAAEDLTETDRSGLSVDLPALLRGYLDAIRRVAGQRVYAPRQLSLNFWTVQDALQRLSATLGRMPEWSSLEQYLPDALSGRERRAAVASTLIASLELARGGGIRLRQDAPLRADPDFRRRGERGMSDIVSVDPAPAAIAEDHLRLAEALVFASTDPVTPRALAALLPEDVPVEAVLRAVQARYAGRGVELVQAAGGWQFRTAPDLAPRLTRVVSRPRRLPRVAMETLAIVAWHQPVTRAQIEEIRGASLGQPTLDALLEAGLVRSAGHREVPGRPTLWATTPQFLQHFGLKDLKDLPRREELVTEQGVRVEAGEGVDSPTEAEELGEMCHPPQTPRL